MTEKSGKILYAEDSETLRAVCLMLFAKLLPDYEIECFEDGTSLEKRLNNGLENVKLVLTDNDMPGATGSSIIMNYAQRPEFGNLPFILFYGGHENIGKELVERHGAFSYISKGIDHPNSLIAKIRKALDH